MFIKEKQINKLIKKQKKLIALLEEKKSAYIQKTLSEVINTNIYSDCIKRVQDVAKLKKGPFGSSLKLEMFVPKSIDTFKVYEQKNAIYRDETLGYYYITKDKFKELKGFEVKPFDIIVSCAGTIGKCYRLPSSIERGIINQALMKITVNTKIVDVDLFLIIFQTIMENVAKKESNGSAIKNIPPFSILKKIKINIPNKNEQLKILDKVKDIEKEFEKLIILKQNSIKKLEEYKKNLISFAVTGQIDVRDYEISETDDNIELEEIENFSEDDTEVISEVEYANN